MKTDPSEIVQETVSDLSELNVPEAVQHSIEKHQANLLGLANALLAAGKTEEEIRSTLDQVFSAYKDELARTIVALREPQ